MKFYSDIPNLHIIRQRVIGNRQEGYELCIFDENGELETEDKEVIRQLQNIYRHDIEPQVELSKELDKEPLVKCKKCGQEFENKGLLMAHYRSEHPKK